MVKAELYQPPPPEPGKKGKKAVVAPNLPTDPVVLVTLHDTVIFPEGGGQPTDTGLLTTADGKQWEVVQCKRHGGHAIHYVRVNNGTVETALAAFAPGTSAIAELGTEGFERRYDHVRCECSFFVWNMLLINVDVYAHLPTSPLSPS